MKRYFLFIIKGALFDFSRNKGRTFLTSLGILIGVCAVVLLLAFGLGLKVFIKSQFEGLGTNLIFVLPGRVLGQGGLRPGGGTLGGARFDEKDVRQIKKIKEVQRVVPYFVKTVKVQTEGASEVADIRGTTFETFAISNDEVETGRLFTKRDADGRSKVVVIGSEIATKLFGDPESALGKTVRVNDYGFKVIGVLQKKGDVSHNTDTALFMSHQVAEVFNADKKFFDIHIQIKDYENIAEVKEKIKTTLLKRYKEDDFSVIEQTEILNTVSTILNAVGLILVAIGAISLVVGGVGIMNIMYVSVTERIKEIGIRRAIGARRGDILFHFLAEAVILSLLGGIAGLLLASIIVLFIQRVFPLYISVESVVLAIGVSSLIGIIFGVFPAKKAADLSPMEAIRYE
ncbi:ABC transporter permease [Candidatus Roizmanbacteria bacterium]|nr:ABC transporter permease [Candidatus Roizmanbacteria bacterium]